jgi:hypothetical protein
MNVTLPDGLNTLLMTMAQIAETIAHGLCDPLHGQGQND